LKICGRKKLSVIFASVVSHVFVLLTTFFLLWGKKKGMVCVGHYQTSIFCFSRFWGMFSNIGEKLFFTWLWTGGQVNE